VLTCTGGISAACYSATQQPELHSENSMQIRLKRHTFAFWLHSSTLNSLLGHARVRRPVQEEKSNIAGAPAMKPLKTSLIAAVAYSRVQ